MSLFYPTKRETAYALVISFFFLFQLSLFAQTGSVSGVVKDKATNEPLLGANVVIEGTSLGAATDPEGYFLIRQVPVGEQTIRISYIGYSQVTRTITVTENRTLEDEYLLDAKVVEGETITITAQASGQLSAINQQLTSNTISNIVSKARINELPDVNAAESIGRLPGVSIQRSGGEANKIAIRGLSPKYNNVTVNGVRLPATGSDDRSVDLSLVSSNILDGIELKKAVTPDMDADVFGGTVDLKIKEAPEGLHVSLTAQGGYNKLQDYYGNYDRSADKFSADYMRSTSSITNEPTTVVAAVTLVEETVKKQRRGGNLVLDYKLANGKIAGTAFYNELESDARYRENEMSNQNAHHYYTTRRNKGTTSIFTSSLGMQQDLGLLSYDVSVAYTSSKQDNPEDFSWQFGQEGSVFSDLIDENTPVSDVPGMAVIDSTTPLRSIFVYETLLEEEQEAVQFNVKVPFTFSNDISGYFKMGGKFRWLDRDNDKEQWGRDGLQYGSGAGDLSEPWEQIDSVLGGSWDIEDIVGTYGGLPISEVLENYDRDDFLDGEYELGFVANESSLMQLTRALQRTYGVYGATESAYRHNSIGSLGSDYDGKEQYQAAYIMAELNLGKSITFIPGVRWERDKSTYHGQRFREIISGWEDLEPSDYADLTTERDNEFWLPMFHLKYQPYDWLQLRLARTETITRPDFIQYAPITSMDGFNSTVQANNASLRPAESANYDISFSVYENYVGLFSVSGFYKSIDDLIIPVSITLHEDVVELLPEGTNIPLTWAAETPTVYTYINNPFDAEYKGLEFEWQTHFWYLPSVLSGLVLNVNYTYIKSETEYQAYYLIDSDSIKTLRPRTYYQTLKTDSVRTGRMLDQPKHVANVTLGYDYKGFAIRLSFLYQTDVSTYIDAKNPLLDNFSDDYARWDLSVRQKLNDKLELFGNFNNLNGRKDRNYRGSVKKSPSYIEYYGFTMDLGVRFQL